MSAIERQIDYRPKILDTPLRLIMKIGQGAFRILFCLYRLPIHGLDITTTKSLVDYMTYLTKNCWRSVDAHFNVLPCQSPLPSITVWNIIWTYWVPFYRIKTWPFGKVKPSNLLAWVALIELKFIYPGEWCISSATFCVSTNIHTRLLTILP